MNGRLILSKTNMISIKIICVLSLLKIVPGCNSRKVEEHIVGGNTTNILQHPYQVSVQQLDTHVCGGSILNANYILTAAHCTEDIQLSALKVRAGSSWVTSGGQHRSVSRIIQHPLFKKTRFEYFFDVALLHLSLALILDHAKGVAPVSLPPANFEVQGNLKGIATGWGRLKEDGPVPFLLQQVVLLTLDKNQCKTVYQERVDVEQSFCAGYPEGGKDTCQGDSGGPYVYSGMQLGITSWGDGCARNNSPGVYTKVSYFIKFIKDYVN